MKQEPDVLSYLISAFQFIPNTFGSIAKHPVQALIITGIIGLITAGSIWFQPAQFSSTAVVHANSLNVNTSLTLLEQLHIAALERNATFLSKSLGIDEQSAAQITGVSAVQLPIRPAEKLNLKSLPIKVTVTAAQPALFEVLSTGIQSYLDAGGNMLKPHAAEREALALKIKHIDNAIAEMAADESRYSESRMDIMGAQIHRAEYAQALQELETLTGTISPFYIPIYPSHPSIPAYATAAALIAFFLIGWRLNA